LQPWWWRRRVLLGTAAEIGGCARGGAEFIILRYKSLRVSDRRREGTGRQWVRVCARARERWSLGLRRRRVEVFVGRRCTDAVSLGEYKSYWVFTYIHIYIHSRSRSSWRGGGWVVVKGFLSENQFLRVDYQVTWFVRQHLSAPQSV